MSKFKNDISDFLIIAIDYSLPFGLSLIAWGLVRYSEFGNQDFWGSVFILTGFFGIIFALAWRYDKGDYR